MCLRGAGFYLSISQNQKSTPQPTVKCPKVTGPLDLTGLTCFEPVRLMSQGIKVTLHWWLSILECVTVISLDVVLKQFHVFCPTCCQCLSRRILNSRRTAADKQEFPLHDPSSTVCSFFFKKHLIVSKDVKTFFTSLTIAMPLAKRVHRVTHSDVESWTSNSFFLDKAAFSMGFQFPPFGRRVYMIWHLVDFWFQQWRTKLIKAWSIFQLAIIVLLSWNFLGLVLVLQQYSDPAMFLWQRERTCPCFPDFSSQSFLELNQIYIFPVEMMHVQIQKPC